MRIKLYQCLCENNRMNKESFLYNELVLDGYSKTPINKMNPSFIVEDIPVDIELQDENNNDVVIGDDVSIAISFTGQVYNYMYVEDWDRYYFIEPITFTNNRMYIVNGTLDTLMSFKNKEWSNHPLYITRRTKGNPFIYDNMVQFKYNKKVSILSNSNITYGRDFSILESLESCRRKYCFIVAYSQYSYDNEYYSPSKSGRIMLPQITKNSTNSHLGTRYFICTGSQISALLFYYYSHSEEAGLVKNVMYLPYEIPYDENTRTTNIGPVNFEDYHIQIEDYPVYESMYINFDRFKYCDIQLPNPSSYRDYEPHTNMFLYIPFVEKIQLDLQRLNGKKFSVYYYVDFESASSYYMIYGDEKIIQTGNATLGYKFNITTSNISENQRAHENNITQATLGTISSVLGSSSSGFNPLKLASGIINNVSQYIQRENSLVTRGQANPSSASSGSVMFVARAFVEILKDEMTMSDSSYQLYLKNIGIPFNDYEFIYNIDDDEHVVVGDTSDVIMSSDVTSQELETFKNALANGFYK